MALSSADPELKVTPPTGKPPRSFKFEARILDPDVATPKKVKIGLHLSPGNELTFPGGSKSISQDETIGKTAKPVTFTTNVNGDGSKISSFKVAMRDAAGNDLATKMVRTS